MSNHQTLPAHIRQLVDKNNFVIAIKTHAQEQNISLEQAKAEIDAYEASKKTQGFDSLTQSLDNHLQEQNIKMPLVPYWVKRVAVIVLVMAIVAILFYKLMFAK